MMPAIYILRCQLQRIRIPAMLFLVLGAAWIAATLIVRTSTPGFPFQSTTFGTWTFLIALLIVVSLAFVQNVYPKEARWSFWATDEVLAWQNQFADTQEEAPLILIAAADVFMRNALDFHLTRAGFRVEHADSCDEALSKAQRRPAAVFLDLGMPNENSFYCLRDIRYASSSSKIIALIRKRHAHDAAMCRRLGAFDSMPKPFDPSDAVTRIVRALGSDAFQQGPSMTNGTTPHGFLTGNAN
jgi:CheY-like chemotaxis protein